MKVIHMILGEKEIAKIVDGVFEERFELVKNGIYFCKFGKEKVYFGRRKRCD